MAWAQHVPRTQDRRRDAARRDQRLAFTPHGDVGVHDRCRMRDADVHEVPCARLHCGRDGRRIDARSTRSNSAAFAGLGCGVPTRCTTVASRGIASANDAASRALPMTPRAAAGTLRSDSDRRARTRRARVPAARPRARDRYSRCRRSRTQGAFTTSHANQGLAPLSRLRWPSRSILTHTKGGRAPARHEGASPFWVRLRRHYRSPASAAGCGKVHRKPRRRKRGARYRE